MSGLYLKRALVEPPADLAPYSDDADIVIENLAHDWLRLQELLNCEARLFAPEGWECSRRGGLHGWEKGGTRVYRAEQTWWSNDRAMTLRGPFRYALEAIEAADKEQS